MKKIILISFLIISYVMPESIMAQNIYYQDCIIINDICHVNNAPFTGRILSPKNKGYIDVRNGRILASCCIYPTGKPAMKQIQTSKERGIFYYYDKSGNLLLEQKTYKGYASDKKLYRQGGTEITPNTDEYNKRLEVVYKYIRENIIPLRDIAYSEMRSEILRSTE